MRSFGFGLFALLALALGLVSCKQEAPSSTAPVAVSPAPTDQPIQLPGIPAPPLDSDDWTSQAYHSQVLTPVDNSAGTKADLTIAWTPAALLLRIHTDDATPMETAPDPWNNDSIEIFMASSIGSDDQVQFICTPGRTPDHPNPAWHINDKRTAAPPVMAPEMHAEKNDKGYTMTILIPWANLKHIPLPGSVIGLQVYANDAQPDGQVSQRIWFPERGASEYPELMQRVQLAGRADAPAHAAAWLQAKGLDETVHVSALADDVGKKIEVWSSDKQVASSQLKAGGTDGSSAEIPLSSEWAKQKDAPLIVTVDGNPLPGVLKIPDLAKRQIDLIKKLPLVANPSIFDGAAFPKIEFLDKEILEAAIGSYSLHIRFFDANWNEVSTPKEPGRYGALVEFKSESGLTFTHDLTLFKTPKPYLPMKDPYDVTVKFPAAFGLPADAMAKEQWNISNWAGRTFQDMAHNNPGWAVLVAGLHDLAADPTRWHGFTAWTIDDIWWNELHKRLGENQDYPHLTQLPDGYDKDQKPWPLIIFLHGSGERGTDLSLLKTRGPLGYINTGHPLPFIVVEPQCPLEEGWNPSRLVRLIDQIASSYRVDPKRIYVTGLSMGGYGSFDLAASYPDKIAAIAPLSGGADPDVAARLKKMPTWIFHGDTDATVPPRYSVDAYNAMQKVGAPVKLTIYPGVGHGGWQTTYSDPALYTWFLQQHLK